MSLTLRRDLAIGIVALAAMLALLGVKPAISSADACAPPVNNKVACENSKPGTDPASWWVNGQGDPGLQGFSTQISVEPGDTVHFKIKSDTDAYHIDILRLGYYNGSGARAWVTGLTPTNSSIGQPDCLTDSTSGLVDCGNWSVSASWAVPANAVSGVYIAHLVRNDGTGSSLIQFVVRDSSSHSDMVVQTSDEAWTAYNIYGGNSLYQCTLVGTCPPGNPLAYKSAFKVSYNRPLDLSTDKGTALFSGAEYSMIRFVEQNGYDVSYLSGMDVASRGSLLLNHKMFMSSGHDEYWSGPQRANVEAARDAGVNLAFFSGNEMYWRTRFEPSGDGTSTPNRTLVAYKDTHFNAATDPVEWTGSWRDPRYVSPSAGIKPENALIGQSFLVNSGTTTITVPSQYGKLRLWRNTDATNLPSGSSLQLAPNTLGYEWDQDADNGFRPAGLFDLSSTTASAVQVFTDYGSTTVNNQLATHNLTLYRAASGALVFGAGTVQWAWGLNDWNPSSTPGDRNMQQATVNLFADMGAQPATLDPSLTVADPSTDHAAPTSTITSPPANVADGDSVTIHGTATDAGGGQVAGVEISTDGGARWHPVTSGTGDWSYAWTAHGAPSTSIKTRAVDDSGNIETPGSGATVGVTCPCSLWGTGYTPPVKASTDPSAAEIGVKFKPDSFGYVSGLRFFKTTGNTGTHTGSLWTEGGQRLAKAVFTNETAAGWQTVTFDQPVQVLPGTTYVASYHAPNGHFAATKDYFWRAPAPGPNGGATDMPGPVRPVSNSGTTTNGAFMYTATPSTFPASTFSASNYWVDPVFTPDAVPHPATGVSAASGGRTSAQVAWTAPSGGGTVLSYKITPYIGDEAQTSTIINGNPPLTSKTVTGLTSGTTYTFTVTAMNPNGSSSESARSNPVTPLSPVPPSPPTGVTALAGSNSAKVNWTESDSNGDSAITGHTVTPYVDGIAQTPVQASDTATSVVVRGLTNGSAVTFSVDSTNFYGTSSESTPSAAITPQATIFDFAEPAAAEADSADNRAVEVGVKFTAEYAGSITGLRFYKAAANTGTHVGTLWAADGTKLASVTFTGESAGGWQTAHFDTPVQVSPNTTYVASYFAPNGRYSATQNTFNTAVDNVPLHAPATTTSANGVYAYSPVSTFPTSTFKGTNYWVDVAYALPTPGAAGTPAAVVAGKTSANVTWAAPLDGGAVTSYKITPYIGDVPQNPTIISGAPPLTAKKVTGLVNGSTYTFTVRAMNANGSGAESARSNAVTPLNALAPTAPTSASAKPASGQAKVTWTRPDSDGDSPITSQTVTPYIAGAAQTPTQVDANASTAVVTGLKNGTSYTFRVTATNAVGTSQASDTSNAVTPEATIFDFTTPSVSDAGETRAIELGVKFKADFDGQATGIRFYKSAANTGAHTGSLWAADGTRLAQVGFTSESATGWQTATFDTPVTLTPGTTYVASYFAPNGHYSTTANAMTNAVDNPPLHSLANSVSANGIYAYSAASAFPNRTFQATSYGVDVLFQPAPAPGAPGSLTATAGRFSADVNWTAPSDGGRVTAYKVTPYAGATALSSTTVSGSPLATSAHITGLTAGTSYTFKVAATNPTGTGPDSAASNAVTAQGPAAPAAPTAVSAVADSKSAVVSWTAPADDGGAALTGYTVTPYDGVTAKTPVSTDASGTRTRVPGLTNGTAYTFKVAATNSVGTGSQSDPSGAVTPRSSIFELATPATQDGGDTRSVSLGVKFQADVAGSVTGLRFYKSAANTGAHVATLWSATGAQLAQAAFNNESASGWQTVTFATPVSILPNTTYVASYLAPKGHYAQTSSAFGSVFANPPLRVLANTTTPNGVFLYSATPVFPTNSFGASNYWVDVLFAPGS